MGNGLARGDWSEERRDLAERMYKAGSSATEIRTELNKQSGVAPVTRNAVIGKLLRMGLTRARLTPGPRPAEPSRVPPSAMPRSRARPQPSAPPGPAVGADVSIETEDPELTAERELLELARPVIGIITVLDLNDKRCKWPRAIPAGIFSMTFCGAPPCGGLPYCAFHARLAYQPPQSRDRRPARG